MTPTPTHSAHVGADQFKITARNLGKRFNREWIFRKLDFQFESGKTYAITGPNGSGKSTLLQVLWGQVPPSEGSVEYQRDSRSIEAEDFYRHLSIAAPYMDLIDEFTLLEQLEFHFKLKKAISGLSLSEIIRIANLTGSENKFIGNFSSGLKQRIKLCLAFYTDSSVLFLDEPGTNLDTKSFDWYLEQLAKLSQNRVVFIASNNSEEYKSDSITLHLPSFKS